MNEIILCDKHSIECMIVMKYICVE